MNWAKRALGMNRAAEILTPLAYSPCEQGGDESVLPTDFMFYLADNALGFGFLGSPLVNPDQKVADRLQVLLNEDWPPNTMVQFSLMGTPDVRQALRDADALREGSQDQLLRGVSVERRQLFERSTEVPIDPHSGTRVRDIKLAVTVKVPLEHAEPTAAEFEELSRLRGRVKASLKSIGLHVVPLDDQAYLRLMEPLVNQGAQASWRRNYGHPVDPDRPLREQVFDFDNGIEVRRDHLLVGSKQVSLLSVKRFPRKASFGLAATFIGDIWEGIRGIKYPFLLTATLYAPNIQAEKQSIERKRTWAIQQSAGPLTKFIPILAEKRVDLDEYYNSMQQNRPLRLNMSLALFSDPEEKQAPVSNVISYFSELGITLMLDRFYCLPLLINALPFGADPRTVSETFRYRSLTSEQIVPLLPVVGDWKGTGTAAVQLVSRNGQLMNVDIFDSTTNYNLVIAAASGSGKSFLANELITSSIAMGDHVWVIDVGRSYEKLAQLIGGDFIHFAPESRLCLNPFPLVKDFEEETDVLYGILAAMAAPSQPLSDFQAANVKRVLKETWDEKGHRTTIDDLAAQFIADGERENDKRISDIGVQLFSFTTKGEYGHYFNGPNNVQFNNRFTVLELEELKGRKHLQQCVLLQLIYTIQQKMYLGDRSIRKLVLIDEAWDLLSKGDVAEFIESGYRRFRKYNGAAITITQSVQDLTDTKAGRAIKDNSAHYWLLGQKAETVASLEKAGDLGLSPTGFDLLKTVHTMPGIYSEIFLLMSTGVGIGRLVVDEFRKLLYSTKATDVALISRLRDTGLPVGDAIRALVDPAIASMRRRGESADRILEAVSSMNWKRHAA